MAHARRVASACVLLSTLATAGPAPPARRWDRSEAALISGQHRQDPGAKTENSNDGSELADPAIMNAAREGGLPRDDTLRLLQSISKAAGKEGSFIVTVTDGAMLGMAKNMIYSLQSVPCKTPILVIGLGTNLCPAFSDLHNTYCVEVFQSEAGSEDEVAWGTHEYWAVVFRKHVVLTLVGMAHNTRNIVYSDPDIVYLNDPMPYLIKNAEEGGYHITFSPNNMLAPDAESVDDIHETYETRGMDQIRMGPHKRRADINTGLFHMSSSKEVADLMLKTMRIFRDQEFVHGHYQQYSLVKALDESPDIHIGVGGNDMLVNGNVFWGHRELLKNGSDGVISIHANWMPATQKIPCIKEAGFWMDPANMHRLTFDVPPGRGMVARLDDRMATVEECGALAAKAPRQVTKAQPSDPKSQEPPRPNQPGCYLWLPKGCPEHNFHAQENWRKTEGSTTRKQCLVEAKEMYKKWCGTDRAEMAFNPPTDIGPEQPQEPGCYVWIASGCEKHNFACSKEWRQVSSTEFKTKDQCDEKAVEKYNRWCDVQDAYTLWIPTSPELPKDPGCYAWFPTGCKNHALSKKDRWIRDTWGEKNFNANKDKKACEGQRKTQIDTWCGIANTQMVFVPAAPA